MLTNKDSAMLIAEPLLGVAQVRVATLTMGER